MSTRWLGLLPALVATSLLLEGHALAQSAPDQVATARPPAPAPEVGPSGLPAWVHDVFIGATAGYAYSIFKHPQVATPALGGPLVAFQIGYAINRRLNVGLVYTDFERGVMRLSAGVPFGMPALHTQADCNHCVPPAPGGTPLSTTFRLATLGPSLDVTPFGRDGLFVGVSGGMAVGSALTAYYGVGGTARGGFRFRPVEMLTLAVEGGVQGETYAGGWSRMGYGGAEIRLSL